MAEKPLKFIASNEVEELQIVAADSIEKREKFWKSLLDSNVYVVADLADDSENITLHTWQGTGEDACGTFTSLEKLIGAMPAETPYIEINSKIIFQSMVDEGMGTFINPRYKPTVRLKSKDLKAMLDGKFSEIRGSNA